MTAQYLFTTHGPQIVALVDPTLETLEYQPWQVTLFDHSGKCGDCVIEAASGLEAATAAVDDWLEENGYKNSIYVIQTL